MKLFAGGRRKQNESFSSGSPSNQKYRIGTEVDARFERGAVWYPGTITSVNFDGTFDISYDDGDEESNVSSKMIKLRGSKAIPPDRSTLRSCKIDGKPFFLTASGEIYADSEGELVLAGVLNSNGNAELNDDFRSDSSSESVSSSVLTFDCVTYFNIR